MNLCFCPSREICFELLILILIPEIIISTPDPWTVDSTSDYIVESSGDIKKKKKKEACRHYTQILWLVVEICSFKNKLPR